MQQNSFEQQREDLSDGQVLFGEVWLQSCPMERPGVAVLREICLIGGSWGRGRGIARAL
jgi:hypothetical protein